VAGHIAVAQGVKHEYSLPVKPAPVLPYGRVAPMIADLGRRPFRWLGIAAVAVLTIIALNENLRPRKSAPFVVSSVPDPYWGKHGWGKVTTQYPSPWAHIMDLSYRLRSCLTGIQLPGRQLSLDDVITAYYLAMVPRPSSFTAYYSSGLDGASVSIVPITRTNVGRVSSVAAPLETVLASNGFTVVRLRRNVIKVFPTSLSRLYSNAPINDVSQDP